MSSIIRLTDLQSPNVANGLNIDSTTGVLSQNLYGFNIPLQPLNMTPVGKTKVVFTKSNSDQSWVVPSGKTYILVKCWGSGGGAGTRSAWYSSGSGGGGGFTRGIIPVTPGETLTIRVGQGGYCGAGLLNTGVAAGFSPPYPYGGGSSLTGPDSSGYYGGYGGGYCGIFRGSSPLLMAGAGGGGGSNQIYYAGGPNGGAGGGTYGLRGEIVYGFNSTSYAEGGTQSAGGAGFAGFYTAGPGSSLQGGSVQGSQYGGGGGGGYYGGGAGNYVAANSLMAAGGGGSGFIGSTVIYGQSYPGKGIFPAGMDDPDYPSSTASTYTSVGFGGNIQWAHGGDSYLTLYY